MAAARKRGRRNGREETTEAILDAAEGLFAERGYSAVTVREIAAAAGVSHALVHRYLGSKADVYRSMLRRRETLIFDAAPDLDDIVASAGLMLREAYGNQRQYLRLVAHSALHGLDYEHSVRRFAATQRLVELAEEAAAAEGADRGPDALPPRFVIANLVALLLGWAAARDWVVRATGIDDMDDDEFLRSFERVVQDVLRMYFPSSETPGER